MNIQIRKLYYGDIPDEKGGSELLFPPQQRMIGPLGSFYPQ